MFIEIPDQLTMTYLLKEQNFMMGLRLFLYGMKRVLQTL